MLGTIDQLERLKSLKKQRQRRLTMFFSTEFFLGVAGTFPNVSDQSAADDLTADTRRPSSEQTVTALCSPSHAPPSVKRLSFNAIYSQTPHLSHVCSTVQQINIYFFMIYSRHAVIHAALIPAGALCGSTVSPRQQSSHYFLTSSQHAATGNYALLTGTFSPRNSLREGAARRRRYRHHSTETLSE